MIIKDIWKEDVDGTAFLKGTVEVVDRDEEGNETAETKEVFFSVPSEYSDYLLTERCDAFVVLLIRLAVSKGYNIRSEIPVSNDLYYNLSEQFLPPVVKNDGYPISLFLKRGSSVGNGKAVGTGLSCGVDSMYTVMRLAKSEDPEFRVTHLCINNVGAFNGIYRMEGIDNVRKGMYENARKAAEEIGLPLIETDSNVDDVLHQNHYLTHTFTSAFAIFCLKKLWKYYFYASSGVDCITEFSIKGHLMFPPSKYELLTVNCFSTPSMRIYIDGPTVSRYEKTVAISEYPVAQRHLVSCTSSYKNCSKCDKCIRNMMTLDSIDKLQDFSGIYDLELYRNFRYRYMWYLYSKKDDDYFTPVFANFKEKDDPDFQEIGKVFDAVDDFDDAWRSGDKEWIGEAFDKLKSFADAGEMHAAFRVGRAYKYGIYVEKSPEMTKRYWGITVDALRQEVKDGFSTSRIKLFDTLWALDDPENYPEMMDLLKPLLDAEDMSAIARMGRACRDGKGVPQDLDEAVRWFMWAYEKDPIWLSELCELLLKSGDEEYYKLCLEICLERCNRSARYAYGFLGRIYRDGKGVEKDLHVAAEWYRKAVEYGVEWAPLELFDVIWTFDDRKQDLELLGLARPLAEAGNVSAMGRLGRMYHRGRGVPKDYLLARRWLRRAVERDSAWFPELYQTLIESGDPRFLDEAARLRETESQKGSKFAYLQNARMYRDGKGVDKDLKEAEQWYRKAIENDMAIAAIELFEIYWGRKSKDTDKEMVSMILPFAEAGVPGAMGRLGRAYRYGRGVPKNLAMAEKWTAKASEKDPARWSKGLEAIRAERES